MDTGKKISELRKKRGLTQEDLALALNVARQSVSKWEVGEALPDTSTILQLAKFFEVSTDYLLCDDVLEEREKKHRQIPLAPFLLSVIFAVVTFLAFIFSYPLPNTFSAIGYWTLFGLGVSGGLVNYVVLLFNNDGSYAQRRLKIFALSALLMSFFITFVPGVLVTMQTSNSSARLGFGFSYIVVGLLITLSIPKEKWNHWTSDLFFFGLSEGALILSSPSFLGTNWTLVPLDWVTMVFVSLLLISGFLYLACQKRFSLRMCLIFLFIYLCRAILPNVAYQLTWQQDLSYRVVKIAAYVSFFLIPCYALVEAFIDQFAHHSSNGWIILGWTLLPSISILDVLSEVDGFHLFTSLGEVVQIVYFLVIYYLCETRGAIFQAAKAPVSD
jgi:transcriptional regulator with XRE-family HTH domain